MKCQIFDFGIGTCRFISRRLILRNISAESLNNKVLPSKKGRLSRAQKEFRCGILFDMFGTILSTIWRRMFEFGYCLHENKLSMSVWVRFLVLSIQIHISKERLVFNRQKTNSLYFALLYWRLNKEAISIFFQQHSKKILLL